MPMLGPILVDLLSGQLYAHFYLTPGQAMRLAEVLMTTAGSPPGPGVTVSAGDDEEGLRIYVRRFPRDAKEEADAVAAAQRA
jgi:hypothetical protein